MDHDGCREKSQETEREQHDDQHGAGGDTEGSAMDIDQEQPGQGETAPSASSEMLNDPQRASTSMGSSATSAQMLNNPQRASTSMESSATSAQAPIPGTSRDAFSSTMETPVPSTSGYNTFTSTVRGPPPCASACSPRGDSAYYHPNPEDLEARAEDDNEDDIIFKINDDGGGEGQQAIQGDAEPDEDEDDTVFYTNDGWAQQDAQDQGEDEEDATEGTGRGQKRDHSSDDEEDQEVQPMGKRSLLEYVRDLFWKSLSSLKRRSKKTRGGPKPRCSFVIAEDTDSSDTDSSDTDSESSESPVRTRDESHSPEDTETETDSDSDEEEEEEGATARHNDESAQPERPARPHATENPTRRLHQRMRSRMRRMARDDSVERLRLRMNADESPTDPAPPQLPYLFLPAAQPVTQPAPLQLQVGLSPIQVTSTPPSTPSTPPTPPRQLRCQKTNDDPEEESKEPLSRSKKGWK